MNLRQREVLGAAALLAIVALFFYLTSQIDLAFSSDLEKFTGPRAYPRIILGAMSLIGLLLLCQSWISPKDRLEKISWSNLRLVGVALALITLFVSLFEPLGYLLTVPPLVFVAALLNRAENLKAALLVAIAASLILLIIFRYGLNTVLPEGIFAIDQLF
tara:strand:- start:359 stop:838 length:480 start_codon:yes stop_codon:yes gene_type:complete